MKRFLTDLAKENWADVVGFAPADRFCPDDPIFKLMPQVKTVIGLGFRILRGVYRGIEEGSTYYQYTTMGVETVEETIMPMTALRVSCALEEKGFLALPQRRHQNIMAEENETNPEVAYDSIYRGKTEEIQMNFLDAAVKCGLGEKGLHDALLNDEYGPFIRYCFVLTDAVIAPDEMYAPHLCDKCGKCIKACPGHAISEDGKVDCWRCAVYYNGANGTKNPFMPPDAFENFEDRLEIIAGEAEIPAARAKEILDSIYFYPPAKHTYQASICGRACDIDCYVHLEELGVLKKKYNSPFRKRDKWEFDINDFK
ncbi:MAG: 4Fe-4S binding protein [Bacillota bacterium]|nr:4Fe-4S binding protein [Bacillota bacterium]